MTDLMQEVSPLVSDFQMLPSNLNTSLFFILASFDAFAQDSLQSSKFLFSVNIESGIDYTLTFVVSQELLQTDINTYLIEIGMLDIWDINFTGEYSKPLPCFVMLDSQGFDFASWQPMKNDWHAANLGYLQPFAGQEFESRLGIGYALDCGFKTRISCLDFYALFFQLNSVEEIIKCFMKPIRKILHDLGMNLTSLFRKSDFYIRNKGVKVISAGKEMLFILSKKCIVDFLAYLERINDSFLLRSRGIQPVFEHLVNMHMIIREYPIYISDAGGCPVSSAIHGTRQFISHLPEGEEGVFLP